MDAPQLAAGSFTYNFLNDFGDIRNNRMPPFFCLAGVNTSGSGIKYFNTDKNN
jgi:hypothetical protein